MIRFLIKLFLFVCLVTVPYGMLQYQVMVKQDPYYWKSTHRAEHLVLGGSRALKGIFPSVLMKELALSGEMLNFAFTGVLSPYGPKYLAAIKRKLKDPSTDQVFILSVCPGNLMDFSESPDARENAFRFYKMWNMNQHPNLEYVLRHPRRGRAFLMELLNSQSRESHKTFRDGAQATYVPKDHKPRERDRVIRFALERSPEREKSLAELIELLAARGAVFLVRVPVSEKTLREEKEIFPDFDQFIEGQCRQYENVSFLNYTKLITTNSYRFTDGNHHLEGTSAEAFSMELASDVKHLLSQ